MHAQVAGTRTNSTRTAARARGAGVDVILDVTADLPHVFESFAGVLDKADYALDRVALFLRQHVLGRAPLPCTIERGAVPDAGSA